METKKTAIEEIIAAREEKREAMRPRISLEGAGGSTHDRPVTDDECKAIREFDERLWLEDAVDYFLCDDEGKPIDSLFGEVRGMLESNPSLVDGYYERVWRRYLDEGFYDGAETVIKNETWAWVNSPSLRELRVQVNERGQ